MSHDLTPAERAEARRLVREADELADKHPWTGWLLRPISRLIRALLEPEL